LTISRFVRGGAPEQIAGHIPLWKPIIAHVLRWLAQRPGKPVVFLLWGNQSKGMFEKSGVEEAAREAGTWETSVGDVRHSHPAAGGSPHLFFKPPNSFLRANEILTAMGAPGIQW
jgi:uracil DNA glycosylase